MRAQAWSKGGFASSPSIRYKRTIVVLMGQQLVGFWRTAAWAVLVASLVATGACSRKIGDACTTSADCDPTTGTRSCDLSQPGGYCVIDGCDARSCPEDSFCLRFFPQGLTKKACPAAPDLCDADEECVGTDADAVCVRRSLEKRVCVQVCSADNDCRGGYTCAPTRQDGTVPLTLNPAAMPKYCRPAS